jgi:serine/threonine protein kinase
MVVAMAPYAHRAGSVLGRWRLVKPEGPGSNGEVWEVDHVEDERRAALKTLRRVTAERYERFRREVATLEDLRGFEGVLPLLDSNLPESQEPGSVAWYVMPIA